MCTRHEHDYQHEPKSAEELLKESKQQTKPFDVVVPVATPDWFRSTNRDAERSKEPEHFH